MDRKKKMLLLMIMGILGLIVIAVGVTYAFFNYVKEGTTENSITTGTITFLYTEISGAGRGISLVDAYPMSDEVGKVQIGEGKVFDFKVTSNTMNEASISYEVTARKKADSTLDESAVKMYLTKVVGDSEEEVLLSKYSELETTDKVDSTKYTEKTIYKGKVPANTLDYEQAFRLRMWIDENADFSDGTMNDKTFTVTVNVYANAKVVTADEEALLSNTNISSVLVNEKEATLVTDDIYDYEFELEAGITEASIKVVTENEYATVNVEKIDSLAYSLNIKRLSTNKTVSLVSGENYFKITVISENKEETKEYKLKVVVEKDTDNTLKSLSLSNCPLNETFSSEQVEYTCTVENDATTTTVAATATSNLASIEGLGEKELTTGENTVTITVTSESGEEKVYTVIVTKPLETIIIFNKTFGVVDSSPTLTTSSNNTSDVAGLYKSIETNSGKPTYYFRGAVDNNYIDFAGFTWRIVRINEDGTIRLIMQDGINNNATYNINSKSSGYTYMYYSESNEAKTMLESWYSINIEEAGYADSLASGEYFCEEAKVKPGTGNVAGSATTQLYSNYSPTFKCEEDGNKKGIVESNIGLITYDEVVYAGGYYNKKNSSYYLCNSALTWWTMSPADVSVNNYARVWYISSNGDIYITSVNTGYALRPVINLKANVTVTGTGSSDDHWVVQ